MNTTKTSFSFKDGKFMEQEKTISGTLDLSDIPMLSTIENIKLAIGSIIHQNKLTGSVRVQISDAGLGVFFDVGNIEISEALYAEVKKKYNSSYKIQ